MSINQGPYNNATGGCTGGATPGAKNLIAWATGAYQDATNLGTYNCRTVRGSKVTSLHAVGRAADIGCPEENNWSWPLADFLVNTSGETGIQCVIHRRKIWSSAHPNSGWRAYTGAADHYDHLHVELDFDGANNLTIDTLNALAATSVPGAPAPAPGNDYGQWQNLPPGARALRQGCAGDDVVWVQTSLGIAADGLFGPGTLQAVKRYQASHGLETDGVIGPLTWNALIANAAPIAVAPPFPLPPGHYFGPKDGPANSISGYYSNTADLQRWQARMSERGWDITADGLYGPQTKNVALGFQREKNLTADGLIGPQTWEAAWLTPIT